LWSKSPIGKAVIPMTRRIDIDLPRKSDHFTSRLKHQGSPSGESTMIFQRAMLDWYEKNRRGYVWRAHTDPYGILVAEIMLQQTNADRVEQVYTRFLKKYPNVSALARSNLQDLRAVLRPLGLDYRAVRLKDIAEELVIQHGAEVPRTEESLVALPGIGRYVANAVLCFAYSKRMALVDVNIIRLYDRLFGFRSHKNRPREDNKVWEFAEKMLPETNFKEYNLALLDFTAKICTSKRPDCVECPVTDICFYYTKNGEINGK